LAHTTSAHGHSLPSGSPASHTSCAHVVVQGPQSFSQVAQVSPASQEPLPHIAGQGPQSAAQLLQDSPAWASHTPSPQPLLHGVPHTAPTSRTQPASQALRQQKEST
jgi:hypothetical protein